MKVKEIETEDGFLKRFLFSFMKNYHKFLKSNKLGRRKEKFSILKLHDMNYENNSISSSIFFLDYHFSLVFHRSFRECNERNDSIWVKLPPEFFLHIECKKENVVNVLHDEASSSTFPDSPFHPQFRWSWAAQRWLRQFNFINHIKGKSSLTHLHIHNIDEGGKKHHHNHKSSHNAFRFYTSFETLNNTRVTAQLGGTATLPCVVDETSPATVTWIRKSDYKLLTGL